MKKERISILCLKRRLRSLKRQKEDKYLMIFKTQGKVLNKIDDIESLDKEFFSNINREIEKVKRLLKIKRNK